MISAPRASRSVWARFKISACGTPFGGGVCQARSSTVAPFAGIAEGALSLAWVGTDPSAVEGTVEARLRPPPESSSGLSAQLRLELSDGQWTARLAQRLGDVARVEASGGAVTVLLLFGLMLTRVGDLPETMVGSQWPFAAFASSLLLGLLITALATTNWPGDANGLITRLPFEELGDALFRQWAVPFEIASLVLLVALIGAIVIARQEEGE